MIISIHWLSRKILQLVQDILYPFSVLNIKSAIMITYLHEWWLLLVSRVNRFLLYRKNQGITSWLDEATYIVVIYK